MIVAESIADSSAQHYPSPARDDYRAPSHLWWGWHSASWSTWASTAHDSMGYVRAFGLVRQRRLRGRIRNHYNKPLYPWSRVVVSPERVATNHQGCGHGRLILHVAAAPHTFCVWSIRAQIERRTRPSSLAHWPTRSLAKHLPKETLFLFYLSILAIRLLAILLGSILRHGIRWLFV